MPGQYYQSETGLNQNLNRDYDPLAGSYIESDRIGLAGGSFSTYAYAGGTPVNNYDPDGLQEVLPTPEGPIILSPPPGSMANQQWNQARDAEAIALQDAAENALLAVINAAKAAGRAVYNVCYAASHAEDKNCEALYQSILRTCASLTGRKRFACFEAARESRKQCYQEKGKTAPELRANDE